MREPPAAAPADVLSAPAPGEATPAPEQDAVRALREWDRARAAAYASGSVRDLRSLYVDGSGAGRRDVQILRAYVDRGLVVRGMRTQVLAVAVRAATPTELRLRVTDRLVGAVAATDRASYPLPVDRPDVRLLHLRRVAGEWRMAGVRPVRP